MREVKEAYERIAEVYGESRRSPWVSVFNKLPVRQYGVVIDVGCGNSSNTRYAVSVIQHRLYVACDVAYNMVKNLHDELGGEVEYINCDARLLPLRSSSVDLYITIAMLHHLSRSDRDSAYAEARRVLKNGGVFLATVWGCGNADCDKVIKWSWGLKEPVNRYYHLFTKGELDSEVSVNLRIMLTDEVHIGRRVNYLVLAVRENT
ncbi:class I SAM-dependent methyltransferase [Caldivirga maquilingensis]|uniref:Methyltransferase type 11 n=1 Tax=Caldivirga maquilingensis (strain ATCC 700844 / DSM 13496 / JCM 10307 / IC-167) TaxID=397948 RepID=A8MDG9_CALMQ|nr:class I SAM-dependent methyltransferase [Caldivirga maquilingensis]ABW01825.1 Methyltransferase type 11 [Caldivirga maquilingensis IC-167]